MNRSKRMSNFGASLFFTILFVGHPVFSAEEQVSGLKVRHSRGQTFITWKEVNPPTIDDDVDNATIRKLVKEIRRGEKNSYRIYRSNKPITSVEAMSPITEVGP